MAATLDQIKELRELTGVSMMACKKALDESDGNIEKAIEILRKKGESKALDRAGRSTSQGVVSVKIDGGKAAMVSLLCETDFVARGDGFIALGESITEKLFKGEIGVTDKELSEVKDAVLKMGENVQIGDMSLIEGDVIGSYIHSNKKIGVLVALEGGNVELAKDIAMHAAATNPRVVSPDEISDELVNKEKEIWREQLKQEGKTGDIVDKIMIGKEKKFREENALTKQVFVKDADKTIEQLLSAGGAKIKAFVRFGI